ncbi:MAG: acetoacetate--CoA ligase [Acidimicrobiia bacterium]
MSGPLWEPSPARVAASNLHAFTAQASTQWEVPLDGFPALHEWSVARPDQFWATVWASTGVIGEAGEVVVVPDPTDMWRSRFFPDGSLSFSENLLRRADDSTAILFAREDGTRAAMTWGELDAVVSRLQQALHAAGVGSGDRVAAWLPNAPEAYALMLATASIGAVFSSCSPDFGTAGVVDRFGQIAPTVLVAVDGYHYDGKQHDCLARLREITEQLPPLRACVVLGYVDDSPDLAGLADAVAWEEWLAPYRSAPVEHTRVPFDHPLYVLYSSGTTGLPKCIVHRSGGILLKHLVEHRLHCDVKPDDRVFYFTTTGWMMWNWLASGLASEAALVVYDGSPVHDGGRVLWDLADETGVTLFGTSAKYLDSCHKLGLRPRETHDLASVRTITSTGSPLVDEGFEYVYDEVKRDVHLASISGGTDLCGCLVAGDPTSPVWAGEIQRAGLGMAIDVFDDDGSPLATGQAGELVCSAPFPSMPIGFWDDPGDARYRAAYFERFPGVWHQGDFAEQTEHGGFVIHGRSDATLNPGGVRIGTAEIYRQVDALDEVLESLVIAQPWDADVRVVLFVVLRDGVELGDELEQTIRARLRTGASPRHVPTRIVAVSDLPRTRSGKLSELAVRDVVEGRTVKNVDALANPESLDQFRARPELAR